MQSTADFAERIGRRRRQPNTKAVTINDINAGLQSTAAYIAELSGELAVMAGGARFANLAHLLAQARLEAELCSRHDKRVA